MDRTGSSDFWAAAHRLPVKTQYDEQGDRPVAQKSHPQNHEQPLPITEKLKRISYFMLFKLT
jgi:hypothetical protein